MTEELFNHLFADGRCVLPAKAVEEVNTLVSINWREQNAGNSEV